MAPHVIEIPNSARGASMKPRSISYHRQPRVATVTAVRFLDDSRVVCSTLAGCEMFVVNLDTGQIEERITTHERTEQIAIIAGDIATSGYWAGSSIYRRDGLQLLCSWSLAEHPGLEQPHGIRWTRQGLVVTCGTTGTICRVEVTRPPVRIACYKQPIRAIVDWPEGGFLVAGAPRNLVATGIRRESRAFLRTERRFWEGYGHIDDLILDGGRIYAVDQLRDAVLVLEPEGHGGFRLVNEIKGFDHPHSGDIRNGRLVVGSCGDSTLRVVEL